jgi:hypothetical protein
MGKWNLNNKFFNKNRIIIAIVFLVVLSIRVISSVWEDSNPLIGEWTVKSTIEAGSLSVAAPGTGLDQSLKFTDSSLIISSGYRLVEKKIIYREDSKTKWSFSTDDGITWENLNVVNSDTMEQHQFGLRIVYSRKK